MIKSIDKWVIWHIAYEGGYIYIYAKCRYHSANARNRKNGYIYTRKHSNSVGEYILYTKAENALYAHKFYYGRTYLPMRVCVYTPRNTFCVPSVLYNTYIGITRGTKRRGYKLPKPICKCEGKKKIRRGRRTRNGPIYLLRGKKKKKSPHINSAYGTQKGHTGGVGVERRL